METLQNTSPNKQLKTVDESLSLRDILDIFLINWKCFLLSVIICVGLARLYLATKPWVFQRQAVMLVKEEGGMGGRSRSAASMDALMQLNGVMTGTSIQNEVYILKSNQLMQQVVKVLNLDVTYTCKRGLMWEDLYATKPLKVEFLDEFTEPTLLKLHLVDKNTCKVVGMQQGREVFSEEQVIRYGETVTLPVGSICISKTEQFEGFEGGDIKVIRVGLSQATDTYRARIKTGEMDKNSSLVRLTCTDVNIQRADDVLSTILEVYKQSIIDDKNQIANSTAEFIDERIKIINSDLDSVENRLAQFKQANKLVDLKQNAAAYLEQGKAAREKSIQLESQVAVAEYMLDYLQDKSRGDALVPTVLGVNDAGIQGQISKYNELVLQRNRLIQNSGESSPAVADMTLAVTQQRGAIIAAMEGYMSSLRLQLQRARQVENSVVGTISSVPEQEKLALDIMRQQNIKEVLYTFLLNKREETALQLAITEANIRIVEHPFGSEIPVAPRKFVISLAALLLGLVLPFIYFRIRAMLNMGVRGRRDIEAYTTIPILGEIPHHNPFPTEGTGTIVTEQSTEPIAEAFRMLRFSLDFVSQGKDRVIMFTSTIPSEGKTFISRNFAVTLAMTGKRVILIDADIRKGTQTKVLAGKQKHGLTSYLSGGETDLDNLIIKDMSGYRVDFLPAGIIPPNPAELLMSDRLEACVEDLKRKYDYVIIDNVPAQVVADAGIVNRVADITLYVIRVKVIDRRYLPELERLHQEQKFRNLHIIINDVTTEHKSYGYGYGYGYGDRNGRKLKGLRGVIRLLTRK